MTLLQPWAAVIAGGVGLGVLTLLYVLKLRRRALRVGSTMLWEQALAEVEANTPWRRLRIDWLFVLQALAIACLAVAIGRPALGIGSDRQRVLVVIDASASMRAIDPGESRTRLAEAKRAAAELVENLRRARSVEGAVVVLGRESRIAGGFSRETAGILEAIEGVAQTDERGDLRGAIDAVRTLTEGGNTQESGEAETVAYVFSDGGFADQQVDAPAGVSVRLVPIGPDPGRRTGNVGIVAVSAQRDDADPATVRIVARLLSTFENERDVSLRVLLDDVSIGSTTVRVPPAAEHTVVLPVSVSAGGVLTVRVLNDDALSSDNAARLVIQGAREPVVVVVAPGRGGSEADPMVVNFAQSVSARSRVIGLEGLPSDARAWAGVDLVIYDRVEPGAGARGLPAVASVSLGAGLRSVGITLDQAAESAGPDRIVSWKRDHPLLRDVVLDALVLRRVGRLRLANGNDPVVLADGLRGPMIVLTEGRDGIGRVVSAFSAVQGGWGSDLSFVVFMGNTLDYLTLRGKAKSGLQSTAGDSVTVRLPEVATTVPLTVVDPEGNERRIEVPRSGEDIGVRRVSIGPVPRAGVYRVLGAADGEDRVAVNVASGMESSLATSETLPIRGGLSGDRVSAVARMSQPREIWDWFVLTALGVLAVEWVAYAVRARR